MAKTPDETSSAYDVMRPYWGMVDDIMGGAPTMRAMKGGVNKYLPRFPKEDFAEYEQRVSLAPFTPLYADAFRNLASKPFSQEVAIDDKAPDQVKELVENIDAAGNHLHVFAREVFKAGINYGIDWIWVGHSRVPAGASVAQRRALGARPYWTRIPAKRMLAVYEDISDGEMVIVHARIDESYTERDGYDEKAVSRIRVLTREKLETEDGSSRYGPATYEVFEQRANGRRKTAWELVEEGAISIGIISLVPFVTGERQPGSFVIRPPLRDIAYMQVTEFQMESSRSRVQTMTAFPVGVFQGAAKPKNADGTEMEVPMGPRTQFWFPPIDGGSQSGDFNWREPSGAAGAMLREDLTEFRKEMREAGMQPLTPQSGNLTATATAVAEAKAHSAVEMWALALKDALEQAFVYTCMWLGVAEDQAPNVSVHTDFAVGQQSVEEMKVVLEMQGEHLISEDQAIKEAKRRNILGPDYDRDIDLKKILDELPGDEEDADARDAVTPPPPTVPAPDPEEVDA
jgi:hypothetical protein